MKSKKKIKYQLSILAATCTALAYGATSLGKIWGFEQLGEQIASTLVVGAAIISMILGGTTVQKRIDESEVQK